VHEVNKWGLAVEQNGGHAEELQADVANLASSITNFKAGKGISELLALVQRAGVAIFDADGKTRNLFDILKGTGDYLRQFNRADASALGRSAGLNEGTLNLLLLQEAAQRRRLADAEKQNNLDDAASERAAALQKQWVELLQSARAFGRELLETITPGAIAFLKALEPAAKSLREILKGLNDANVGQAFATAINAAAKDTLQEMPEAMKRIGKLVNGWNVLTENVGTYGTSYEQRALIALGGLGANLPEDAIYPTAFVDAAGQPLHGANKYVAHFDKGKTPPANAFWSITMYDKDGFQVPNPIDRFAVGDRDKLTFNADGSLDIYVQAESPGKDKESNWLPAPKDAPFAPSMRIYSPRPEVADGSWAPPGFQRVEGATTGQSPR